MAVGLCDDQGASHCKKDTTICNLILLYHSTKVKGIEMNWSLLSCHKKNAKNRLNTSDIWQKSKGDMFELC